MGLPMACFLADSGFAVSGVDINLGRVESLKCGVLPFGEKGLPALFKKVFKKISFHTKPIKADVFIISVPTPITQKRGIDLSYVVSATESIVPVLSDGNLVILESTVSPGTCAKILKKILDRSGKKYFLAHCPERAFPGKTMYEMVYNDRVIGGIDKTAEKLSVAIYKTFIKGEIITTDATTAETVKILENAYRNVNIAFANEIAKASHVIGINVWEAISLANHHPRVNISSPGPGVGGHCIPLDPWFLVEAVPKYGAFLRRSLIINEEMGGFVIKLLLNEARKGKLQLKKIGVLGVAYKGNIDDPRETPALGIIRKLKSGGFQVRCSDPYVKHFEFPITAQEELLRWADAVVILTDHKVYKKADFSRTSARIILDTRNILTEKQKDALTAKDITFLLLGNGKKYDGKK